MSMRGSVLPPATPGGQGTHYAQMTPPSTGKTLAHVQNRMNALGDTLRADITSKREYEENRLFEMRELTNKVEKHLALEVKRRAESDKVLQNMFEGRMKEMQAAMDKKFTEKFTQMQLNVDILTKKLVSLEKELVAEREKNAQLIQKLNYEQQQSVQTLKNTLEQDKVQRMEKEAQVLRKSAEDTNKIQNMLAVEKQARDVGFEGLREAIAKLSQDKDKHDEKFKSLVLADIEQLKAVVRMEHDEREQSEEQLVATMDQIVQKVEDALRVISK
eukprot:TRINITY_DN2722_c0_g1_i1.p1 TRINITY_DN2722_c0_g1~~TRINITY_DN2722_c0_g1_i1.p1  ORF type:complete len:283 (+),score=152.72 TRINITY_DN2722_c0_g1_i1:32-850(+)